MQSYMHTVMKKTYAEKLKDPRWQRKRLEVLQRDNWECQSCKDTETTLHVHHKVYWPNVEPWDYPDVVYITYCENCHRYESQNIDKAAKQFIDWLKLIGLKTHDFKAMSECAESADGEYYQNPRELSFIICKIITEYYPELSRAHEEELMEYFRNLVEGE